jgi:hypothetical protein
MRLSLPTRFWIEVALGLASAALTALTIVWPDWIERLFGFEPDGGDGSTEWGFALSLVIVTIMFSTLAGRTWWRHTRLVALPAASSSPSKH